MGGDCSVIPPPGSHPGTPRDQPFGLRDPDPPERVFFALPPLDFEPPDLEPLDLALLAFDPPELRARPLAEDRRPDPLERGFADDRRLEPFEELVEDGFGRALLPPPERADGADRDDREPAVPRRLERESPRDGDRTPSITLRAGEYDRVELPP